MKNLKKTSFKIFGTGLNNSDYVRNNIEPFSSWINFQNNSKLVWSLYEFNEHGDRQNFSETEKY